MQYGASDRQPTNEHDNPERLKTLRPTPKEFCRQAGWPNSTLDHFLISAGEKETERIRTHKHIAPQWLFLTEPPLRGPEVGFCTTLFDPAIWRRFRSN